MTWVSVASVEEFPEDEGALLASDPPIGVFKFEGSYYAIDDTCSHDKSSLCEGYLDGGVVECAWHFSKFDIRTGEVLTLPATRDLRTYPVRIRGSEVQVKLPEDVLPPSLRNT